jgi:hypothetical protein
MNESKAPQNLQQTQEERGAAVEHSATAATSTPSITRNKMKVSDRIQAMNKIIDEELEEPPDMVAVSDTKSLASTSGTNYPKRSSVVEMWKKREASIKSSSATAASAAYKFEEKKEVHAHEEDESASESRMVTPERSGPESDDSNSNLGSYSSGSVRRSSVRDAWKKRAPTTTFTTQTKGTSAHFVVISPDTTSSDHNLSSTEFSSNETRENATAVPASPSSALRKTWRKMENNPKPQHIAQVSPAQRPAASCTDRSQGRDFAGSESHSNAGSSTAFDELRSKWAKFGVQKVQARENGQIKPAAPLSPVAASSFSLPSKGPSTPVGAKTAAPVPEQTWPFHPKIQEAQRVENESPTPSTREDPAPVGRKSQLVKMGQLHASRPKAESSPAGAKSCTKRHNTAQYSPKCGAANPSSVIMTPKMHPTGVSREADGSPKGLLNQKSADSRILLKAKHRRRAQLAQSSTAAATSGKIVQKSLPSREMTPKESSEDSFPLDEMDPDAFGQHTKAMKNMIRSSLPMRTLFGSQSGESLGLGVESSNSDASFPHPIQMTNTDVVKTSFDSWSNFDSFQEEDLRDASLDSFALEASPEANVASSSAKPQTSSHSLTTSALKRLREKRQKHFPHKVDPNNQQGTWDEKSTPQTAAETPVLASTSRNAFPSRPNYSPASPDPPSTISASMCSETTFSNSYMQSTNASGNTTESDSQRERKMAQLKSSFKDVVPDADTMIPDEFVSEKNANVQSFQAAYENMSLEQIANDMKEEASSVLSMNFLSNDLLNKSMYAAGESLNKLVAGEMFKKQQKHRLITRAPSPVEEVAIEVEYIADDDYDQ